MSITDAVPSSDPSNRDQRSKTPQIEHFWPLFGLAGHHTANITQTHSHPMQSKLAEAGALLPSLVGPAAWGSYVDYVTDAVQRWILFLDILRERGNSFIEREKQGFKPVLAFEYEYVLDGRKLERPANYALVRITPPAGYPAQQPERRPFVIIDPRAGQGSGIGGSKAESQVGVALRDGHPVYFVIFYFKPEPSQTLADVCAAEAAFLQEVRRLHPIAPSPLIIGNCQGGWASMILAATHPDLMGPVVISGAPLSYWAGEVGKNPLRYLGGLAGGAVPALLASDLGNGMFDGASLVLNFEQLNPAKTLFRKYYDVYADPDTKGIEFLDFERWWSGFYFMNEAEIRWMVENLFIGNRLTRGEAVLDDGTRIDLTRIRSPVIVFASHGDNITPPQQALNWIPDLYRSVDEIRARGRVIIYTLHDSIGHLGIFVSAKVASKQHKEVTNIVKMIEALSPGLYELIIDGNDGAYEVSFEARSIGDILKFDDGREEETRFAAVAKLSEWSTKTYELTMRPILRSVITPEIADTLVTMNPIRQRRYLFSDQNPLMTGIEEAAANIRHNRKPATDSNPFVLLERIQADLIEQSWNFSRDIRDAMWELSFNAIYSSPWIEVIAAQSPSHNASHDIQKFPEVRGALERTSEGGYAEAIVRLLVLLAKARGSVRRDRLERSNRILHSRPPFDTMTPGMRAHIINEQSLIVQFAPEEALQALPRLLRDDVDRVRAVNLALDIAGPVTDMDAATINMFKRIQGVLLTMALDWHEPHDALQAPKPTTDTANGEVFGRQSVPTGSKGERKGGHVEPSWVVANLHEMLAKQKWFAPFAQFHWWR